MYAAATHVAIWPVVGVGKAFCGVLAMYSNAESKLTCC